MAYFSNGTESDMYQDQFCSKCKNLKDGGCPILDLHLVWNYDLDNEDRTTALNHFIPRSKDGLGNQRCEMFRP